MDGPVSHRIAFTQFSLGNSVVGFNAHVIHCLQTNRELHVTRM
jgi:hypothetical protein